MDSALTEGSSIPLFIELKNDVDTIMSLNDSSLSQQIEFILQDPIAERTPPATPKLNLESSGTLASTSRMATSEDNVVGGEYELMDPTVIKVERMDEDDDVGREEEITTLNTNSISTNTDDLGSMSLLASVASDEEDDEDGISPSSASSSSVQVKVEGTQGFYLDARSCGMNTNYHPRRTSSIEQTPTTSGNSSSSCSSTSSSTVAAPPPATPPIPPQLPREYQCFECVEKFDNKELFEIHKTGHANNMKCAICNMVLKSLKNYEKHCLRCKPYECQICGRVVRFRPNFIKHMRVHTGQQSERHKYKCDVCLKEFMSFEYFKVHKKIHNDNVNLTCEICGKVFSALASLRGHSKLHSGVKLHKCDVCGKGFGQRYNLKIHARTHTGDFPFECKICKKKLHTQSSLQTHMQTHQKDQTSQVTTTIKYEPLVAVKVKLEPIETLESLESTDQTQLQHQQQELQHHQQLLHQHEMLLQPKQEPHGNNDIVEDVHMYSQCDNGIRVRTANATTNTNSTTTEESSNESLHDNNMTLVIKNDVQNGPPTQVTYAQQQPHMQHLRHQNNHHQQYQRVSSIIKSTTTSLSSFSQSPSSLIISPSPSPSSSSSSSSAASSSAPSPLSIGSASITASTSGVGGLTSLSSASSASIRHANENSPSLATTALVIKSEPHLYSSGDNSVDMFIKKEIVFDECSAPSQNSPPISKFHTNFDSDDLVDAHDLTHSLPYSNLFGPNSIPDSIPDDLYPDDPDDFRLDHSSLGLQSSTTDGDFIKKEWVYGTGSGYSINGKFDDDSDVLCDPANFIYN